MALTNKGKIKINDIEIDVADVGVSVNSLESADSGRTDDGVYHYNYVYNRSRKISVKLPPCSSEAVSAVLDAVQGKTYTLTYFDPIDGEKTIQAHTGTSSASLYSGVLLNGLWTGVKFTALQIGGETVE